jgi:hypothetical protein
MAPSVSYSITVRLEVASRGRAVSEITRAVEHVTCAARDEDHAGAIDTMLIAAAVKRRSTIRSGHRRS